MVNLQIPLTTMIDNINRRIAFLRKRGEYEDMVAVDRLSELRGEYTERLGRGETIVVFEKG